jgi:hypothetical protein
LRTRTLLVLAVALLTVGVALAVAGLYPDIDSPRVSRLGLLLVLVSIPVWNTTLLRRAKATADQVAHQLADQLNDEFEAGYRLCASHFAQGANVQAERGPYGRSRGAFIPRLDVTNPAERHGR